METTTLDGIEYELRPVRWGRAIGAGLAVGALFLLFSRGLPWASSGLISLTVMGREVKPPQDFGGSINFGIIGLHLLSAVVYALIIVPIIHRLHPPAAMATGAALGILFYFASHFLFANVLQMATDQRELHPFITHLAFGAMVAGFYKGQTRRRVPINPAV